MLALTRRIQEKIMVGDSIEIVVLEISGGQVKLGVHAPKEIGIDREEVRIKKNMNRTAAIINISEMANV